MMKLEERLATGMLRPTSAKKVILLAGTTSLLFRDKLFSSSCLKSRFEIGERAIDRSTLKFTRKCPKNSGTSDFMIDYRSNDDFAGDCIEYL